MTLFNHGNLRMRKRIDIKGEIFSVNENPAGFRETADTFNTTLSYHIVD